jgi:hypothetical protein
MWSNDGCVPDRTPDASVEQIVRIKRVYKPRATGRTQVLEAFAAHLRSTQNYSEQPPDTACDWPEL